MTSSTAGIVLGSFMIIFIWWLTVRRLASLKRAPVTNATVIEMIAVESTNNSAHLSYIPRIRFQAHDGTEHVVTRVYSGSRKLRVGQTVRVVYDPTTYNADILRPRHTFSLIASASLLTAAIAAIIFSLIN